MITKAETALTQEQYDALKMATTPAARRLTLQRINWVFGAFSEGDPRNALWDVEWCLGTTSQAIRVYRGADAVLHIERFNGTAWADTGTSVATTSAVTPSVACSGNTVRVFYYKSGEVRYLESTDGGASWGGEQTVGTLSGVVCLAATGLTKTHVGTYDDHNTHLYLYEYVSSWTQYESDIYYPHQWSGFDAESIDGRDVLVFTARGPTRYESPRQGVWALRVHNHHWSDPIEVEVIDEFDDENDRMYTRLSLINSRLWVTFVATDGGHAATCYAASSDGRYWQHRQPVGGSIAWEGKITHFGDYVYLMDADTTRRSASTVLSGNATVEEEITDRVDGYRAGRQGMHQSSLILHNEDGHFDSYLETFNRYQLVEELGYVVGGASYVQQVALTEVDAVAHREDVPADMIEFVCRDRLSWMADRSEADHYQEWISQLRHYDDFVNMDDLITGKEILDTGMRYTHQLHGYWDTEFNELHLASNNKEGLALCTISKFISHTIGQQAVRVPTTGNDEWAGYVFRALDEDNFWCAYYNEGDDTIKIRQKRAGEWQSVLASSTTLGYGPAMWIWIRVEAKLSLFTVYHSTDGLTWTLAFSPVVDISNSFERAALQEGYVGHAGYGYSDEDQEPEEPPAYDPPVPYSGTDSGARILGTDVGIAITNNVMALSPHYYTANAGLSTDDDKNILALAWDPDNYENLIALTKSGLWRHVGFPDGTWTQLRTRAQLHTDLGEGDYVMGLGDLRCSIEGPYVLITWNMQTYDPVWGWLPSWPGSVYNRQTGAFVKGAVLDTGVHTVQGRPRVQWAQHSAYQKAYVTTPSHYGAGWEGACIWRTTNGGTSWSAISAFPADGSGATITIPYDSPNNTGDLYGYAASATQVQKTVTSGTTWTVMSPPSGATKIGTGGHHNYIWVLKATCQYSENGGGSWTNVPTTGLVGTPYESSAVWLNGELKRAVVATTVAGIFVWDRGDSAWLDKTGDLQDAVGATSVQAIERFGEDLF